MAAPQSRLLLIYGLASEAVLALLALALAFLFLGDPLVFLSPPDPRHLLAGLLAVAPPAALLFLVWADGGRRLPWAWRGFEAIVERLRAALGEAIAALQNWEILVLSFAAGIGEELLFRGVLQPLIGWVAASLLFGLVHAVTPGFLLSAAAAGFYLGWLYQASGSLAVPIIAHAGYDVLAFLLLRRLFRGAAG